LRCATPATARTPTPWLPPPRRLQQRYETRFQQPLAAVFAGFETARGAPRSPILESLAFFARATGGTRTPRRIILVSDLLQNTGSLSLYRGQPDVDAALGTHGGRRLAAVGLAGAVVDLVDPQWHARAGRDSDERLCFWRELPARVGADVRLARPVRCAPRAVPRASP
jgi:hypothetical protein